MGRFAILSLRWLTKDYIPPPRGQKVISANGVRMMLPSNTLPLEKGMKRKVISSSKIGGTPSTRRKVMHDVPKVGLRRSSRVATMNSPSPRSLVHDAISNSSANHGIPHSDDTDIEGSPLSADANLIVGKDSGAFREGFCEGGNNISQEVDSCSWDVLAQEEPSDVNCCGENNRSDGEDMDPNIPLDELVDLDSHEDNCDKQDELALSEIRDFLEMVLRSNSVGVSALVGEEVLPCDTSVCLLAPNSNTLKKGSMHDWEMRLDNFMACFDTKDRSSITIDDISPSLSGDQSIFEGKKVPSEFVIPLTRFAEKYGGGSLSSLFADERSSHQRYILIKELGSVLLSMEREEVKTEETFLAWIDAC